MRQISARGRALPFLLTPLALAAAGCVPAYSNYARTVAPQPAVAAQASPAVPAAELDRLVERAANQVRRCYRGPRIAREGRQIVTRLRVRFSADGALSGMPVVVSQSGVTPANRFYADEMARAATAAIIRCTPVHLPPELWERGWSELDLIFSPRGLA